MFIRVGNVHNNFNILSAVYASRTVLLEYNPGPRLPSYVAIDCIILDRRVMNTL